MHAGRGTPPEIRGGEAAAGLMRKADDQDPFNESVFPIVDVNPGLSMAAPSRAAIWFDAFSRAHLT